MGVGKNREMVGLCRAKLYEFELISRAEEKIGERSEDMAALLGECALKSLRDYRALCRSGCREARVKDARPRSERIGDIIDELIDTKTKWISQAQRLAFGMSGCEKDLLLRICESEAEEIYKLRRCLT